MVLDSSALIAILLRDRRTTPDEGSPGVLNYGDRLAYAVATALGEPLLFTGGDFPRADVAAAPY